MRERRPGGELGCRMEGAAAIGNGARLDESRAVAREVLFREAAARAPHVARDAARELALVELARPPLGETPQRACQAREIEALLLECGPRRDGRPASLLEEGRGRAFVRGERARGRRDDEGRVPVDQQAVRGELGRRHDKLAPRLRAEGLVGHTHAVDRSRHGDGTGAHRVPLLDDGGPGKEVRGDAAAGEGVVRRIEPRGRAEAEVDRPGASLARAVDHHGAAAAGAAHPWLEHAEREGGGDRRIDGVSAAGEH